MDFDLVVLGSGPAGESAAVHAARLGKRVAVVEREPVLGGTATNTGTVPSKTLRETALYLSGFRSRGLYGVDLHLRREASVDDFLHRERHVKESERSRIARNLQRHRVELLQGRASLVDRHTVAVHRPGAPDLCITGEFIFIATGSRPHRPPLYPFGDPRVHDSDELLELHAMPHAMVVVGGGVIGCEYACMFSALGVPVSLVEPRGELLSFLDEELSALLARRMGELGVRLHLGASVQSVHVPPAHSEPIRLTLSSGQELETDQVLVASGRTANTDGLGLGPLGVKLGSRGQVEVGAGYQTSVPNLYAVGDVIGFPALASTSMEQARLAVQHAFGKGDGLTLSPVLPYGIYTIPEVSMAGETEEALRSRGVPYVAGRAHYSSNSRGQIIGDTQGLLKLLFHRESLKLLGVHILGEQASELVHVGLLALMSGAGAQLFSEACFNYPTLSEAYKAATDDALAQLRQPVPLA